MTKRLVNLFVVIAASCTLVGCGTTNQGRYRRADLHDVINVKFHYWSLGAAVNVGPANVGIFGISGPDAYGYAVCRGITGTSRVPYSGLAIGLGIPVSRISYLPQEEQWMGVTEEYSEGGKSYQRTRNTDYYNKYPGWGSIGIDVGLIFGIGCRFDVFELVDYISGYFGKDLMKDDNLAERN